MAGRGRRERSHSALSGTLVERGHDVPVAVIPSADSRRGRYKLGFRDVAELLLQRGYEVTHETIRGWETRVVYRC